MSDEKLPSLYGSIGDREDIVDDTIEIAGLIYRKVPLRDLTVPKNGYICMTDRYWLVTKDNCVLFYGDSPQCHGYAYVLSYRKDNSLSDADLRIVFVALAYRPPDRE